MNEPATKINQNNYRDFRIAPNDGPYSNVFLDYVGPFIVTLKGERTKIWILIWGIMFNVYILSVYIFSFLPLLISQLNASFVFWIFGFLYIWFLIDIRSIFFYHGYQSSPPECLKCHLIASKLLLNYTKFVISAVTHLNEGDFLCCLGSGQGGLLLYTDKNVCNGISSHVWIHEVM